MFVLQLSSELEHSGDIYVGIILFSLKLLLKSFSHSCVAIYEQIGLYIGFITDLFHLESTELSRSYSYSNNKVQRNTTGSNSVKAGNFIRHGSLMLKGSQGLLRHCILKLYNII